MTDDKPRLGISSCLLGNNVRYDGGHKLDRYLADTLGEHVRWVPVCPEVECGLGVPRESLRLVGDPAAPRLLTVHTRTDLTDRMQRWAEKRSSELKKEELCGFVFKSRSPSSGLRGIKVYDTRGNPAHRGQGVFARVFTQHLPQLPVEDEGRLNDGGLRENFVERVFVFWRWRKLVKEGGSLDSIVRFHTDHKLLVMAHSPAAVSTLGRIVAGARQRPRGDVLQEYQRVLMDSLALAATVRKNVNVLQHSMGYFKKVLSADEKAELTEVIGQYHQGLVPLVVPVVLLRHYARKYAEPYLLRQLYLNPYPAELMLRNHV
jgi:uncharacterized protein YbgA (DUF1722 family)/uncharacterized protein YbbK (DUF523 family)